VINYQSITLFVDVNRRKDNRSFTGNRNPWIVALFKFQIVATPRAIKDNEYRTVRLLKLYRCDGSATVISSLVNR